MTALENIPRDIKIQDSYPLIFLCSWLLLFYSGKPQPTSFPLLHTQLRAQSVTEIFFILKTFNFIFLKLILPFYLSHNYFCSNWTKIYFEGRLRSVVSIMLVFFVTLRCRLRKKQSFLHVKFR